MIGTTLRILLSLAALMVLVLGIGMIQKASGHEAKNSAPVAASAAR